MTEYIATRIQSGCYVTHSPVLGWAGHGTLPPLSSASGHMLVGSYQRWLVAPHRLRRTARAAVLAFPASWRNDDGDPRSHSWCSRGEQQAVTAAHAGVHHGAPAATTPPAVLLPDERRGSRLASAQIDDARGHDPPQRRPQARAREDTGGWATPSTSWRATPSGVGAATGAANGRCAAKPSCVSAEGGCILERHIT